MLIQEQHGSTQAGHHAVYRRMECMQEQSSQADMGGDLALLNRTETLARAVRQGQVVYQSCFHSHFSYAYPSAIPAQCTPCNAQSFIVLC